MCLCVCICVCVYRCVCVCLCSRSTSASVSGKPVVVVMGPKLVWQHCIVVNAVRGPPGCWRCRLRRCLELVLKNITGPWLTPLGPNISPRGRSQLQQDSLVRQVRLWYHRCIRRCAYERDIRNNNIIVATALRRHRSVTSQAGGQCAGQAYCLSDIPLL